MYDAELVSETVFVPGVCRKTGGDIMIPVTKRRIELSAPGRRPLVFTVSSGKCGVVITDHRPRGTGAARETNRGPLPGERYCKAGTAHRQTPTAWVAENARLIAPAALDRVVIRLATLAAKK